MYMKIITEGMDHHLCVLDHFSNDSMTISGRTERQSHIVVMHGALHGVEVYHGPPIFFDLGNSIFQVPPPDTLFDEPILWESVVAYVEFQGRNLQSITFRPIAQSKIGEGQSDVHDEHTDYLFLQTRGLPKLATREQAHYILERLADLSRLFGTTERHTEITLNSGN